MARQMDGGASTAPFDARFVAKSYCMSFLFFFLLDWEILLRPKILWESLESALGPLRPQSYFRVCRFGIILL